MKKSLLVLSVLLGLIIALNIHVDTYANGMPCTEAALNEAKALKAAADAELATAVANKNAADLKVMTLNAQGVTGLDILVATDAATNAANMVSALQGKAANAQAYIDNLVSRANTEQYQLDMEAKWKKRAELDSIKMKIDALNAQIQYMATMRIDDPVKVVSLQSQINELNASYNAILNSDVWATDADNANYKRFVEQYGSNLPDKELIIVDGNYVITYPKMPNEWSIRWFE